jgi:hypothetical protein
MLADGDGCVALIRVGSTFASLASLAGVSVRELPVATPGGGPRASCPRRTREPHLQLCML